MNIDKKIKIEYEQRKKLRRYIDVTKGLSMGKSPQRGDYKICQENQKVLNDYRRFKSPKDREKIKSEYFGRQEQAKAKYLRNSG